MSLQEENNITTEQTPDPEQVRNPLGYEKLSKLLRQFAIPSVVAMLVSSLYNIVDQIFIGNSVGYMGNAATNVALPLTTICIALALLVGIGSAARFSLKLGAKEYKEVNKCVGNAFWLSLFVGVLCLAVFCIFLTPLLKLFGATDTVLPYALEYSQITILGTPFFVITHVFCPIIRSDGSPRYSMLCTLIGAIINTILDPIFIFVFNMGIQGAAWATITGQFISFLFVIAYFKMFKHVRINRKAFRFSISDSLRILPLGLSNCFTNFAVTVVQIVMNNSLNYYGAQSIYGSDIALSAFGVVMKVNTIFLAIFVGVVQGAQPIIGFNYGAKQFDRVKKTYKLEIIVGLVVGVIAFILFQFFPQYVISLFGSGDALYMEFAVRTMRIFLFMIMLNSVQTMSANFFAAIGKPLKGIFLTLSRTIFFFIPIILVLPLFMGIDGITFTGPIADTLSFTISIIMIRLAFKKMGKEQTANI